MKLPRFFFPLALLILALGCVSPGASTPAPAPAPLTPAAAEDFLLPTLVAEKVFSGLTQTAQAATPTFTPSPAPSFTPEPPSPTPTPPIGSSLSVQENGATLFVDERAGYMVLFPAGWLLARPNQPELEEALAAQSANPALHEALSNVLNRDQNILRLYAIDANVPPVPGEPLTTVAFILDETRGISFNSDQDLKAIEAELLKSVPGMETTALDILIPPGGIPLGAIESVTPYETTTLYEKRVYFMGKTGLVYALLTTGASAREESIPAFDALMSAVRLR